MEFKDYLYKSLKRYETSLKPEDIIIIEEQEKQNTMKDLIEFTEFMEIEKKLEIKLGQITSVEDVPKSKKLIKLSVDFGTEVRTVVTNIKPHLSSNSDLVDKKMLFITNLKPVVMMGIESTAMILPGEIENGNKILSEGLPGTILL